MNKKLQVLLTTLGLATLALMGAGCDVKEKVEQTFCKHEYGVYTVTKEAKCYEEGEQERTCGKCGNVSKEKIAKTSHTPGEPTGYVAPTCTEKGAHASTKCAIEECGAVLQEGKEIPALGHEEHVLEAVERGCLTDGLTEGKDCSRCGEVLIEQEVIPSFGGHAWQQISEDIEPTCQEEGYTGGAQCQVCGTLTGGTVLPVTEHAYDDNGSCKVCGCSEELATVAKAVDTYYHNPYYMGITSTNYDRNYGESFLGYTFRYLNLCDGVLEEYGGEEAYFEWAYNNGYGAQLPEKLYIVTVKNNMTTHTPVSLNKGRLSLNGKILKSNVEHFTDGNYSYVRIPETGLEVEGFENIVDCRYCNPKDITYKDKVFIQLSNIEVLNRKLNVVAYEGSVYNALEKQDNGLYKYTFASQGDFVMNEAVEIGVGETLVCDFHWKQGSIWVEDKGWFGVVFGDGKSLENYPHTEYGMRNYSESCITYMENGEVITTDQTKTIHDIDGQHWYRITLTKESTGLYSYRLYSLINSTSLNAFIYTVIDEYLNFECPTPSALMLCTHQDEGNTNSTTFVFDDLVFYKM